MRHRKVYLHQPVEFTLSPPRRPSLDNLLKPRQAIRQSRGTWLQDQGRFYLIHVLRLHSRGLLEARPCRNALGPKLLATPGADDQIRLPRDHLLGFHNTVLGCALISKLGEDVDATGDLDELRDPRNAGDQRIVPLLEEHPRLLL